MYNFGAALLVGAYNLDKDPTGGLDWVQKAAEKCNGEVSECVFLFETIESVFNFFLVMVSLKSPLSPFFFYLPLSL